MRNIFLAILLILIIGAIFSFSKIHSASAITVAKAGNINEFTPGTMKFISKAKAFVIADNEGIYAISAVCTHLECLVTKNGNKYTCPCHASEFDLSGRNIKGPAKRDLDWYSLELDKDNNLILDTGEAVSVGTKLPYPQK